MTGDRHSGAGRGVNLNNFADFEASDSLGRSPESSRKRSRAVTENSPSSAPATGTGFHRAPERDLSRSPSPALACGPRD